jgi:hypothetical protein
MKPKGSLLPLLCALLVMLAVPTGATARSSGIYGFGDRSAEAHLPGTHGYRITITANSGILMVVARKGTASVSYVSIRGGLKGDRIHARLPGVGRVFLEFHEHGRPHSRSDNGCRGSATLARRGVFVGTVKIRGERNYTSAVSHHVRGEITGERNVRCHHGPVARASRAGFQLVSASATRGSDRLSFSALTFPLARLRSDLLFSASLIRVRGKMMITTTQGALGKDPTALEIAAPPRTASVDPPAPFIGSANFQQEAADQFSWTGDLAVELPGVGEVSLAGSEFETAVCVGHRCRGDKDETETSEFIAEILG